jgi:hypothetical protein
VLPALQPKTLTTRDALAVQVEGGGLGVGGTSAVHAGGAGDRAERNVSLVPLAVRDRRVTGAVISGKVGLISSRKQHPR